MTVAAEAPSRESSLQNSGDNVEDGEQAVGFPVLLVCFVRKNTLFQEYVLPYDDRETQVRTL